MSRSHSGVTLVEMVVALALLSMLSVGVILAFQQSHRAYERISYANRSHQDVVVVQRFFRTALENTYPFESDRGDPARARGLEGSSQQISFTTSALQSQGAAGHRRYIFRLEPQADGFQNLVATSEPDRNGLGTGAQTTETVMTRVQTIEWSYFDSNGWRDAWSEQHAPSLVRLRVSFPPGDSRRWPELIVAPRITDDANCPFDVISQQCREAEP
jgi:general secretion pathway protein J